MRISGPPPSLENLVVLRKFELPLTDFQDSERDHCSPKLHQEFDISVGELEKLVRQSQVRLEYVIANTE